MKTKAIVSALAIVAAPGPVSVAQEHGAHVHGEADLSVVVDGDTVSISLFSAMYNIVGFERAPATEAETEALETARETLADGSLLFSFDPAAGCLPSASAHNIPDAGADDHGDTHHDHDDDAGHGHRDLEADYTFECATPSRLTEMKTALFASFPRLEKVKTVVLRGVDQTAVELSPNDVGVPLKE